MKGGIEYSRDQKGQGALKIVRSWQKTQASENNDTGRESTSSMHLRYEELGGRVLQWSDKDTQGMNQKARCIQETRSREVQGKLVR